MKHNDLKEKIEVSLCKKFLVEYNVTNSKQFKFERLGNPNLGEVDCICTEDLNIEVSTVYANQYQGEKVNSYRRGFESKSEADYLLSTEENLERIVFSKLNKLNNGNYLGTKGDIYLLVEIASQMYTDEDIRNIIKRYAPFKEEAPLDRFFKEVWAIWIGDNGGYQIEFIE